MALALPGFGYRAVMDNGVVEHEVCPVVVAEIDGEPDLNPDEVGDADWVPWASLRAGRCPSRLAQPVVRRAARPAADAALRLLRSRSSDDRLDEPIVVTARLPFG